MMCPPADSISAFSHTVRDSDRMPWAPMSFFCGLRRLDDLVPGDRLRHVQPGRLGDRLAVPEQLGVGPERDRDELAVPRRPLDAPTDDALGDLLRDVRRAPVRGSRPGRTRRCTAGRGSSGRSRSPRPPGGGPAARAGTASPAAADTSMRYFPSAASLQRLAISAWPPLSGLMYQVSVGGPPDRRRRRPACRRRSAPPPSPRSRGAAAATSPGPSRSAVFDGLRGQFSAP